MGEEGTMTSHISRRETCRMCGSCDLKLVFQMAPSPIGDAFITEKEIDHTQDLYPIDLFMCQDCGLTQLLDVFTWKILYKRPKYHNPGWVTSEKQMINYVNHIQRFLDLKRNSFVVEIGNYENNSLPYFYNSGMRVLCVDPSYDNSSESKLNGIEIFPEFLKRDVSAEIRDRSGPADVIIANNIIANIDDLKSMIENIRSILAPDGVFTFESIYLADLILECNFDFVYHEHLSSFSVKPVQRFFECIGMELFDVERVPAKGGSLRYFVQLADGPRAIETAVTSLIDFEEQLGLYSPKMFSTFSDTVDELKVETHSLLQDLKAKGKHIAGFGASITGTTLIYHFGIGEFLDYLIDDNPAKQGRFSPGLHLPVFSSEKLYERKPDYVVILAWRFVEPIVKKNNAYLEQGGHFIVPIPEVRII